MAYRNAALFALAGAALAASITACGGGSAAPFVSPSASPSSASSPTAPPIPQSSPFAVATSVPLPAITPPPAGQTPQPIPLAAPTTSAGFGANVALPIANANAVSANTQAVVTLSNQFPTGAPASFARRAQTLRALDGSDLVPMLFLEVFFSGGVTLANQPPITFTVPSADLVSGASYWVALYDPTRPTLGWQKGFEGPGTVGAGTIAFTGGTESFSFVPFYPYVFALYAQPAAAPTPTAPPTPTPTPVPTATPSPGATPTPIPAPGFGISPSSISLNAAGATQTITVSGTAPYFALSSAPSIVTVAPANGNGPFTATAVSAGTAQITIVDSTGKQAIIPVTVTTVTIPVQ